ncbi:hypothetical protein PVNG_05517 [Plasmodium vivax North Korean]|uniref:Uncharacterized protein n=1 Tax=Plasmodium vivax North Korean TaxID=1035514 RepID=A0A0J9U1R1_PLAVI|nr:hypothetical protein PVNG_05517 [Plasmodium vivax North Korean]
MLNFILSKNYKKNCNYIHLFGYYFFSKDSEIIKIPEIAFSKRLYDEIKGYENIDEYIQGCDNCRYPFKQTEEFIRKLARNYDYYKQISDKDSYIKYCKYLTYWMYTEKINFSAMQRLGEWNNCIPCVWKNLEKNNNIIKGSCNFNNDDISYSFIQVMKLLHEMCLIRGNDGVVQSIKSDGEMCVQFNEKLKTDLKNMLFFISTISGEPKLKKSYFDIYNGCALKDVKTPFKEIECKPEVKETCPEPKTCDTAPPCTKQKCTENSCSNLQELCSQFYAPQACQCEEKVIKIDCQDQIPDILKQSCPSFCAENPQYGLPAIKEQQEKSNKNPLLQVPVTVLSSVVGTIFFFLLLYKV